IGYPQGEVAQRASCSGRVAQDPMICKCNRRLSSTTCTTPSTISMISRRALAWSDLYATFP
ncbi:hypothetical protein A2U01_0117495, partial [Trifolium medium]|nr:hypothetical protein [Trifolium medium]